MAYRLGLHRGSESVAGFVDEVRSELFAAADLVRIERERAVLLEKAAAL